MLVTGASGFLGRALVAYLRGTGVEVVTASRADGFDFMTDDLPLADVRHVFHLAGETGVLDAWQRPDRFHLVNAHGTVRVLEQARATGSSVTFVGAYIYGIPHYLPIDELHPVAPNNPYAFSKWMGEEACRWYAQQYGMNVTAIRLFNVYGPGQASRFLVARIVEQVTSLASDSIEVMDLTPRRDYLHVDDAVAAFVTSLPAHGFQVFNVGSGCSYSVREVIELAMDVANVRKTIISTGEVRHNEIPDVVADCTSIRNYCSWTPRISLGEGIRSMIQECQS